MERTREKERKRGGVGEKERKEGGWARATTTGKGGDGRPKVAGVQEMKGVADHFPFNPPIFRQGLARRRLSTFRTIGDCESAPGLTELAAQAKRKGEQCAI